MYNIISYHMVMYISICFLAHFTLASFICYWISSNQFSVSTQILSQKPYKVIRSDTSDLL
jgi:hypothetical protein